MLIRSFSWIITDLIGKTLLIVIAVTIVVGFFLYSSPGRVDLTLPVRAQEALTEESNKSDDNFFDFYFRWAGRVLNGELGRSALGQKVGEELRGKIWVTGILCISGAILSVTGAFFFGFLLVTRVNHPMTRFSLGSIYLLTALPTFFLAYLFISFLSLRFEGPLSYVVPVIILAFGDGLISDLSRIVEGGVKDELKRIFPRIKAQKPDNALNTLIK